MIFSKRFASHSYQKSLDGPASARASPTHKGVACHNPDAKIDRDDIATVTPEDDQVPDARDVEPPSSHDADELETVPMSQLPEANSPELPEADRSPDPDESSNPTPSTSSQSLPERWQAPSPEELEKYLTGYRIVGILGHGGMGAVYEGIHEELDRRVAIKILPPNLANDVEFETRFKREARAMAKLNHPQIIQIYDFGKGEHDEFYLVMEYVDGSDLHKLRKAGQIDEKTALQLVAQICDALQYAHDKGFVHRDIKPANIILNSEGQVKVGDFGLAKIVDPDAGTDTEQMGLTMTGISMGTPHYMAPEQMTGAEDLDHRVDIYSLGVMFYELLTGEIPRGNFPPPSKKVAKVDEQIDEVVLKAMASDPESRYQQASEIRTDVNTVYTKVFEQGDATAAKTSERKKSFLPIALACAIVATLVGVGLKLRPWESEEDSPSTSEKIAPVTAISLPPELAAMKQRGGRLRSYPESETDFAEGIDDLVAVFDGGNAIRADKSWVGERVNPQINQLQNVVKVQLGSVLQEDGSLCGPEDSEPIQNVRIFETGQRARFILYKNGRLEVQPYDDVESHPAIRLEAIEAIEDSSPIRLMSNRSRGFDGLAILEDGTAFYWHQSETGTFPPEIDGKDFVEIGTADIAYIALKQNGEVETWMRPSKEDDYARTMMNTKLRRKAYALRTGSGIAAVQLGDGTWHAWGTPGNSDVIAAVNDLGVAIDLQFHSDGNSFWWIEPTIEDEEAEDSITLKAELPPALAKMRAKGGRLKSWSEDSLPTELNLEKAQGLDDLTTLDGHLFPPNSSNGQEGYRWMARTASGDTVTSMTGFSRSSELLALGSHYAVLETGEWLDCWGDRRELQPGNAITAWHCSGGPKNNQFGLVLNRDGSLLLINESQWSKPELSEVRSTLEGLDDVIQIEQGFNSAAVLRANGDVILWNGNGLAKPDRPVQQVVDISCGGEFCVTLDSEGRVQVIPTTELTDQKQSYLKPPSDLGVAYAVMARASVIAAQMADGSWRAWGNSEGVIDQINSIGPAVDILFNPSSGPVLWIEPSSRESTSLSAPSIDLPPKIAAWKAQGGRLKGWGETRNGGEISDLITSAEDRDDIVRIDGGEANWLALTRSGEVLEKNTQIPSHNRYRDICTDTYLTAKVSMDGRSWEVSADWMKDRIGDVGTPVKTLRNLGRNFVALADDGSVHLLINPDEDPNLWEELRSQLSKVSRAVELETGPATNDIILLLSDGSVMAWNDGKPEAAPSKVVDIVQVDYGGSYMALNRNGEVFVWGHPQDHPQMQIPPDLGPAIAIHAHNQFCAAQMRDGTWRAWGTEGGGVVDYINHELGPAIDLDFGFHSSRSERGYVYWIEPVEGGN